MGVFGGKLGRMRGSYLLVLMLVLMLLLLNHLLLPPMSSLRQLRGRQGSSPKARVRWICCWRVDGRSVLRATHPLLALLLLLMTMLMTMLSLRSSSFNPRDSTPLDIEPDVIRPRRTQRLRDGANQRVIRRQPGEMIDCRRGGKSPARCEEGEFVRSGQMCIGVMETGEIAGDVGDFLVAGPFEEGGWVGRDGGLLEVLRTWVRGVVVQIYASEGEGALQGSLKGRCK